MNREAPGVRSKEKEPILALHSSPLLTLHPSLPLSKNPPSPPLLKGERADAVRAKSEEGKVRSKEAEKRTDLYTSALHMPHPFLITPYPLPLTPHVSLPP